MLDFRYGPELGKFSKQSDWLLVYGLQFGPIFLCEQNTEKSPLGFGELEFASSCKGEIERVTGFWYMAWEGILQQRLARLRS